MRNVNQIDVRVAHETDSHRIQKRLEKELLWLKETMGLDLGVRVVWKPSENEAFSGEVRGQEIIVYDTDEGEALKTLRHEMIDLLVSKAIEPYKGIVNSLIKIANDDAYRRKETVVGVIARFVSSSERARSFGERIRSHEARKGRDGGTSHH